MNSRLYFLGFLFFVGQLCFQITETAETTLFPGLNDIDIFNCTSNAYCGPNGFCTTARTCACAFGWTSVIEKSNNKKKVICKQVKCIDCASEFGPISSCIPGSSFCQCPAPAILNTGFAYGCEAPLGGPCQKDSHCSQWAICNAQACTCPFGYLPDGPVNCKEASCSKDNDCQVHFGIQSRCRIPVATKENVTVRAPFCACKDALNYFESGTTGNCEKRTAKPRNCTKNSDCPEYSLCEKGACACEYRTIHDTTADSNGNCAIFDCINDDDCNSLWPGTKCEPRKDGTWRGYCFKPKDGSKSDAIKNVLGSGWICLLLIAAKYSQFYDFL